MRERAAVRGGKGPAGRSSVMVGGVGESENALWATLRRLRRDPVGMTGAVAVVLVLLVAAAAPLLAPFDPTAIVAAPLAPPGSENFFGTDHVGRDTFSRVLYGAQVSLPVSLIAVSVACMAGILVGLPAGFFQGRIDALLMRSTDVMFAIPALILAMVFVAVLGPDLRNLLIAMVIVFIPTFARLARGMALSVGARQYVEAARATGATSVRIMLLHVLPNAAAPLIVQFTAGLSTAILIEASLSFLGLGVPPPAPSWGSMLDQGKLYIDQSPWLGIWAGLAIFVTVLGFNLLGDGLRDATDPHLRER